MQAAAYTDFGALAGLRSDARQDAGGSLREVAEQFESLFVQMMLKAMRDATPDGGLFESNALDNYEQMYDQQLAVELSSHGGIGLADVIVNQLSHHTAGRFEVNEAGLPLNGAETDEGLELEVRPRNEARSLREVSRAGIDQEANDEPGVNGFDGSPEVFIDALRPQAERIARRLGVAPEVLLAQAALETGWGQRISADERGSSNNLFNIKADERWAGPTTTIRTVEYRDGVAVREMARFRAYDTAGDSFEDYATFIEDSARYRQALEKANDSAAYLRELQRAGYATDPAYAEKIERIMDGAYLSGQSATLKLSPESPLRS